MLTQSKDEERERAKKTRPKAIRVRLPLPYTEYVAKLGENTIARTVKLADLRHNSDPTRLDTIDEKARERMEKYKAAIRLLSGS